MKIFSKKESFAVFTILLVIFILSFFNYRIALRRGRDNERENDLGDIAKVLEKYREENSIYPPSLNDPELAKIGRIPEDPGTVSGYSYFYRTDGKYYQLYTSLEGKDDEDLYNPVIENLKLMCGKFICNYGRAPGNVPLDKSIEEYENEIKNEKN